MSTGYLWVIDEAGNRYRVLESAVKLEKDPRDTSSYVRQNIN